MTESEVILQNDIADGSAHSTSSKEQPVAKEDHAYNQMHASDHHPAAKEDLSAQETKNTLRIKQEETPGESTTTSCDDAGSETKDTGSSQDVGSRSSITDADLKRDAWKRMSETRPQTDEEWKDYFLRDFVFELR